MSIDVCHDWLGISPETVRDVICTFESFRGNEMGYSGKCCSKKAVAMAGLLIKY